MTPNVLLTPSFEPLSGATFGTRFPTVCVDPAVSMAYGRLDVSRDHFLEEALLISFRALPAPAGGLRAPTTAAASSASCRARSIAPRSAPTGRNASAGSWRRRSGRG